MTGTPENAAFSSMDAASRPRRGVLAAAVGTAALAGLLFGFDTAVIAGVTGDLTALFALTPAKLDITVSAALKEALDRSEELTSALQYLMRRSVAVVCLNTKTTL